MPLAALATAQADLRTGSSAAARMASGHSPDGHCVDTDLLKQQRLAHSQQQQPQQQQPPQQHAGGVRQRLQQFHEDPAAWARPDDSKKTLPPQWRLHQSTWRFLSALAPYLGPPTHSLLRVWAPALSVLLLCAVIKLADGHIAWKLDQNNYSLTLYRSSSFMLSLLLSLRLGRTYDRWWQARSAFGGIGGGIVNIVRQVATYTDDPVLIRQYQKWGMAMVFGIVQLINNTPKVTDPRVEQLLDPHELALYNSTTKPSKLCGTMLSALTSSAGFEVEREVMLNQMLGSVASNISQVARIKLQAMPFGLSLFCTGYTYIWLLVVPFGIFPEASWWAILPVSVMTHMMLGLEDLAIQLEDPFKFFAYEAMIATTAKDMPRTVAEVQRCKAMIQGKNVEEQGTAQQQAAAIAPWPEFKPRPQLA